jgi:hypothetical protein
MLFPGYAVDVQTIHDYLSKLLHLTLKHFFHGTIEHTHCIVQVEGHNGPIKKPKFNDRSISLHLLMPFLFAKSCIVSLEFKKIEFQICFKNIIH